MQCLIIRQKLSWNLFQTQTCIHSLKKVRETEFLIFLRGTVKPTIGSSNFMTQNKNQNNYIPDMNNLYDYTGFGIMRRL